MKQLFRYANEFVRKSDWKDLALVKFCLCSIGVMLGMALPKRARKPALLVASLLFIASYVPLMTKFLRIVLSHKE